VTTTEYASGYVYENNTLQFFNTAEGYVSVEANNSYSYVYNFKDHLDNIRLSYTDGNGDGSITGSEIVKESNYYPFGLSHKGYNNNVSALGNSAAKRYMFGGKELSEELGLIWYDVSARNYDPALGKWMNIDPLAEQMRRHSPYNYAFDNPIYFQDPDGMAPVGSCCGGNPVSGIGEGIARSFNSAINKANEGLKKLGNQIKSLFKDDVSPTIDTGDDFTETGAEIVVKETSNKVVKNVSKKVGIIGTVNTITSLTIEASENGISEEFVQNASGEVVANATGPASGFTEIILDDSKSDDGVTNTSNMANNFSQSGRSRNAFIYQNFTMRNSGQSQELPPGYNSLENRTERARVSAENGTWLDRFWFKVLPPR